MMVLIRWTIQIEIPNSIRQNSINQSINQSVPNSIRQNSINQSINQSQISSGKKSINQSINQSQDFKSGRSWLKAKSTPLIPKPSGGVCAVILQHWNPLEKQAIKPRNRPPEILSSENNTGPQLSFKLNPLSSLPNGRQLYISEHKSKKTPEQPNPSFSCMHTTIIYISQCGILWSIEAMEKRNTRRVYFPVLEAQGNRTSLASSCVLLYYPLFFACKPRARPGIEQKCVDAHGKLKRKRRRKTGKEEEKV